MKVHPFVGCTVSIGIDRWFRHTLVLKILMLTILYVMKVNPVVSVADISVVN